MIIIKLTEPQYRALVDFYRRVNLLGNESDMYREVRDIINQPFTAEIVQKEELNINRKDKENGDKIQTN